MQNRKLGKLQKGKDGMVSKSKKKKKKSKHSKKKKKHHSSGKNCMPHKSMLLGIEAHISWSTEENKAWIHSFLYVTGMELGSGWLVCLDHKVIDIVSQFMFQIDKKLFKQEMFVNIVWE